MEYIFIGTGHFAKIVLEELIKKGQKPMMVVTEKAKAAGRGGSPKESAVMALAKQHNLKVSNDFSFEALIGLKPELILLTDFGKILPSKLTTQKDFKTINLHPSLLPKYRGPSPIQAAILSDEKKTGVTIIELDEQIDHGPIIAQEQQEVAQKSYPELLDSLAKLGAELFLKIASDYLSGKIKVKRQVENRMTMTKKIKKDDGKISFSLTASQIEKRIRALRGWPGTYVLWDNVGKQLKISQVRVTEELPQPPFFAGTVFKTKGGELAVACGKESLIIERLQLEGKKEMSAAEFLNGYPDINGGTLR